MEYIVCPLRDRQFEIKDFWNTSRRCTYCGSIMSEDFFHLINEGYSVRMDKETRTLTFTGNKSQFYLRYQHLNQEERNLLVQMYSDKRITLIS